MLLRQRNFTRPCSIFWRGMISESYPLLEAIDRDIDPLAKTQLQAVGIVKRKDTPKRTVGRYFTNGDYNQQGGQRGGVLCGGRGSMESNPAFYENGTGSIISSNTFVTAYHVIEALVDGDPQTKIGEVKDKVEIVFNFLKNSNNNLKPYSIDRIVEADADRDWIVLKTTKGFTHNGGTRFGLDRASDEEDVYVLQHPLGQPMRYAGGKVINVDSNNNLGLEFNGSGFPGTSGSPVVSKRTGNIVGLFCFYNDNNGANDWIQDGACYKPKVIREGHYERVQGPLAKT